MNMQDFADALASKDLERYSSWFADDMRLYVRSMRSRLSGHKPLAAFYLSSFRSLTTSTTRTSLPDNQRTRLSFARKLAVFRLKALTMCERMKPDLLRSLALRCVHLER
jgi:hypothetical protein